MEVTEKLYKYTVSEVIAKLWSVCKWIDKYILGINAYIHDITGEGLVIGRFKTRGYVTQHEMYDYDKSASYSLRAEQKNIEIPIEHCPTVDLTIDEFDTNTFGDMSDETFESFANEIIDLSDADKKKYNLQKIYLSNTFETPVNLSTCTFIDQVRPRSVIVDRHLIEDNNITYISSEPVLRELHRKLTIRNASLYREDPDFKQIGTVSPVIDETTGEEKYKIMLNNHTYISDTEININAKD